MNKYLLWFLLLIFTTNIVYSNNISCIKPDEYILKCQFEPTLKEKSFTCINENCSDKLYTLDNKIFLADFQDSEESLRILDGQINLNQIQNHLELVQVLCKQEISPKLLEIFDKKISQTNSQLTQSFTGNFLVIEQEQYSSDYKRTNYNCYNSIFETYLGWEIETREKKEFCNFTKHNNTCYTQEIDIIELLKESNEFNNLVKYSFVLIFAIFIGITGLFTHLIETKKLKDFLKVTKSKIIIAIILFYPILFILGKIIDLILFTTFVTSKIMPALTFVIATLIIYFFASLIKYTHDTHKSINIIKNKKKLKKIIRKKKRI
jgi:hypothetical protein